MRWRYQALIVLGLMVSGCERNQDIGLPLCDTPDLTPEVRDIISAREAMSIVPAASGDPSLLWDTVCVRISPIEPVALETGAWSEGVGDDNFAAGSYAGLWRKTDGSWRLDQDIKTLEGCAGSLCP